MITIGNRRFEVVDAESEELPKSQQITLKFLSALSSPVSIREAVRHLGLQSPAPLFVRLEHLCDQGRLREVTPVSA
jgi:hypothetical protein